MHILTTRARRAAMAALPGLVATALLAPATASAAAIKDTYEGKTAGGRYALVETLKGSKPRLQAMFNVKSKDLSCTTVYANGTPPIFTGGTSVGPVRVKPDRTFSGTTRTAERSKTVHLYQEDYDDPVTGAHVQTEKQYPVETEDVRTASIEGRFSRDGRTVKGTFQARRETKLVSGELPPGSVSGDGACDTGRVNFTVTLKRRGRGTH